MNLYKYVSTNVLNTIIDNNMIRFTQTCCLNDPYEGHFYEDPSETEMEKHSKQQEDPGEILTNEIHRLKLKNGVATAREAFGNKYGILSLSRTPYSILMWTHYAENHKGCVIELDAKKLPNRQLFGDVLYDVGNGNVIYSSMKSDNYIRSKITPSDICYLLTPNTAINISCLINKNIEWSYEEEVRIIRDLSMGLYNRVSEVNGEKIYLYRLAPNAIKSIILGERFKDDNLLFKMSKRGLKIQNATISKEKFEISIQQRH